MSVDDIKDLRINQFVYLIDRETEELHRVKVVSINDWTKSIGVVNRNGEYKEYPPRLIKL